MAGTVPGRHGWEEAPRPAGLGGLLRGARAQRRRSAGCSRPAIGVDTSRSRHQPPLLAAAVRRPPRRARRDVRRAQCDLDGDRRHAGPGSSARPAASSLTSGCRSRCSRACSPDRDRLHDTPPDKSMWLHVFGRLKPGVSFAEAEAQANAILQANLAAFYGRAVAGTRAPRFRLSACSSVRRTRRRLVERVGVLGLADGTARRRRRAAAHRLCQSRQPAAGARRRAPDGDRAAALARRQPRPPDAPTGDRESRSSPPLGGSRPRSSSAAHAPWRAGRDARRGSTTASPWISRSTPRDCSASR